MRKVIRSLIIEQIEKDKLLKEVDVSSMTDIFQTLWNLASAGFISYHFAKAIYNSYKSGKKTEEEIEDMVQGLTIDFLKNGDDDLDHLDKTVPYDMSDFDRTVEDAIEYDDTVEMQRNYDDTAVFDVEGALDNTFDFDHEELAFDFFDDETESDDTEIRSGRRGDTRPL